MSVGLLALLDDIAMLADDTATMTKISMQKTAGILGDDLAVNAKQASGFLSSRELPVLFKITKGALLNKFIILPFAFLLTAFMGWVIPIILIFGGLYLSYEGSEKIYEFLKSKFLEEKKLDKKEKILEKSITEEQKIKSAIFTDFILSIEIIIIALSSVLDYSLGIQIIVVSIVAILATLFVYGFVALIVRLDDIGFYLQKSFKKGNILNYLGFFFVLSLPFIIKSLSIIGTLAMLLVAGNLFRHNIIIIEHIYESINFISPFLFDIILGFLVGMILLFFILIFNKILGK